MLLKPSLRSNLGHRCCVLLQAPSPRVRMDSSLGCSREEQSISSTVHGIASRQSLASTMSRSCDFPCAVRRKRPCSQHGKPSNCCVLVVLCPRVCPLPPPPPIRHPHMRNPSCPRERFANSSARPGSAHHGQPREQEAGFEGGKRKELYGVPKAEQDVQELGEVSASPPIVIVSEKSSTFPAAAGQRRCFRTLARNAASCKGARRGGCLLREAGIVDAYPALQQIIDCSPPGFFLRSSFLFSFLWYFI